MIVERARIYTRVAPEQLPELSCEHLGWVRIETPNEYTGIRFLDGLVDTQEVAGSNPAGPTAGCRSDSVLPDDADDCVAAWVRFAIGCRKAGPRT